MANYKITKGAVGPWTEGTIITDDDLKANPGLGGTARLRDQLGVIEDTFDEPAGNPNDANSPARSAANTTGNPARASKAAADAFKARAASAPNGGGAAPQNPSPPAGNS